VQLAGVKGEAFYIAILRESFRDLITSIRGFCQIAGGNQRGNTAVHPLESHGAPEDHTVSSTYVNDVNVTSVDRPSMAKLRFVQHPCCKLLIIN
tara:strand:+ start:2293 stop:2574 length:282 start_codon:yes stop_codon:yes gene_type:complete